MGLALGHTLLPPFLLGGVQGWCPMSYHTQASLLPRSVSVTNPAGEDWSD